MRISDWSSECALPIYEEAGNAGFVIRETGWSPQKMTAAFTPRDVTFVSPTTLKYSTTIYRVDRTDLAFSEEHKIGEKSFWRRGSCELAPDRKSTRLNSSH